MSYNANAAYSSDSAGPSGFSGELRGAVSPNDLSLPLYGASFGQAIKRFFKNYVNFKGRASRSEYWFSFLFGVLIMIVPLAMYSIGFGVVLATAEEAGPYGASLGAEPSAAAMALVAIGGILLTLFSLALLLPQLSVSWRRLHDANYPGPLWFLSLIPFVGTIILVVLMVMPSKPEGQRFDR